MNFGMSFGFSPGTYILGFYDVLPTVAYYIGTTFAIGTATLA